MAEAIAEITDVADVVNRVAEELKQRGQQKEADALEALLDVARAPNGYYTSEEVAARFKVTPEIIVAFVRKGTFKGIVIGQRALIPKSEFTDFQRIEKDLWELDELTSRYTQEEIIQIIREVRSEWHASEQS